MSSKELRRVLTFGVFDPLHKGHLNFFKEAKKQGDHLTVVVAKDSFIKNVKGREPVAHERERLKKVEAIDSVDEAIFGDDWPVDNKYSLLGRLQFNVIALGYDQAPGEDKVRQELKARGKEDVLVITLKSFFPDKYKSSHLRKPID
jgi:FAD synthetase